MNSARWHDDIKLTAQCWTSSAGSSTIGSGAFHEPPPVVVGPSRDDPLAMSCLSIATFINNVAVAHPLTVLRRQCQVHQSARKLHLTPITLVPVVVKIVSKDGITTLWKGVFGTGVLWSITRALEIVVADFYGLPRQYVPIGSADKLWRFLSAKATTTLATTSFTVVSFIETVRSTTGLSLDDTKIFDVLIRGFDRLRLDLFAPRDGGRRFSVFYLAAPTILYGTSHFLIGTWLYDVIYGAARRYVSRKAPVERTRFHSIMPQLFARITSTALANIICYPAETILHRLYIQGTRTLIDNLDTGASAISVSYKYSGFFDCFKSIVKNEGVSALYSGVGAIGLQYALQFLVLRSIRFIFDHASNFANAPLASAPTYNSSANLINGPYASAAPSAHFTTPHGDAQQQQPAARAPDTAPFQFPSFAQTAQSADAWPTYGKNTGAPNIFER